MNYFTTGGKMLSTGFRDSLRVVSVASDVKSVAVSLSSASPADPAGRATIGFYVLEGDVLTMTDGDGKPVRRRYSGEVYMQQLAEGDDPSLTAKRLTLAIWRSNTGRDASGGFNRP